MAIKLDALGAAAPFRGFASEDFDAFEKKKWSSRVYTKERRAALQKLVVIGRSLPEVVPDLASYDFGTSDDAPSMVNNRKVQAVWLYITRPNELRSVISSRLSKTDLADTSALFDIALEHQHACVLLAIDHDRLLLELHISPRAFVDRMNAENKLNYQDDREALISFLNALPEDAEVGFEDSLQLAQDISRETIEGWQPYWATSNYAFVIRYAWGRDEDGLGSEEFAQEVRDRFTEVWPIYEFLAWSTSNDFAKVVVEKTMERVEKKMKKVAASNSEVELAPGDRVTILSGLFAGRAGYLAETDGKGQVKVMVGPVSVSVPVDDVKPS